MAEATDKRQDEQIEKLWDAHAGNRRDIAALRTDHETLKTVVLGSDGKNGLGGRVRGLEESRDELEERIMNAPRDCPIGQKLKDYTDISTKGKSDALTARRFFIGQAITILIFLIGLYFKR